MKHGALTLIVSLAAVWVPRIAIAQNIFVGNLGDIYQFTPGGVRSIFASGVNVTALAYDGAGDLFAASNGYLYKYSPGGTSSVFASGLTDTEAMAFDRAGNLFVATASSIYKYTPGGVQTTFASGFYAAGLACDSAGDLFASANYIYKITPDGTVSTFAPGVAGGNPAGLTFNRAGDLFAAATSGRIYEYTPGGVVSTFASGLDVPNALAFDNTGNLFVTEFAGNRITQINPDGDQSIFGSMFEPLAIAIQPVPEPRAFAMFALAGLIAICFRSRPQAKDQPAPAGDDAAARA